MSETPHLEFVKLGPAGNSWTGSSLAKGGPLSGAVLAAFDLAEGTAYTVLRAGIDAARAKLFARGGIASTRREAPAVLATLKDKVPSALGLAVEDDLARPTDPAVRARSWPAVSIDGWLLPWIALGGQDPNELVRFLNTCSSGYPTNAFALDVEPAAVATAAERADVVKSEQLASHVLAVITAAYDSESFIVWQPPVRQPNRHPARCLPNRAFNGTRILEAPPAGED